ncbi:4'-phosphopantetheinyl transferase superfamily protein [Psychroflexus sp. CAK57W]|uniref:4'-phosphopantetheinyl transferase family protein n=1 Tax=Psychroflexus curvus TaxID=2873595 RepID=UPI001CC965AA|nr:4'-phosphopantetheinyl transferase superfamily protein [Psychroflexus curvus]MBZ9628258.1 4'-phosphopantetheinyl transferase superfamily protein [Psychroflexus curvus]MBZ9788293.1 4'-phosphopantetheinyl transferase superfamily protein [Psychroflexus curvus]
MSIYKRITVDEATTALIWKIEESLEALENGIELTDYCRERYDGMKSLIHRKGFMSIRHLLKVFGYSDFDLSYDEKGKPHLKDGKHISITHSFEFTAVIVSNKKVGIDIEKQREKIKLIAPKFTPIEEYKALGDGEDLIRKLTIVWGAKESLYKLYGKKGLLFLHDIFVEDFNIPDQKTTARVTHDQKITYYTLNFMEFENFTCVYALAHD